MKSVSLPLFASLAVLALALAPEPCRCQPGEAAVARPSTVEVPVVPAGEGSRHFVAVASRLELGGHAFVYRDTEGVLDAVAEWLQPVVDQMAKAPGNKLPPGANLSLRTLLGNLGLNSVSASGMSVRKMGDLFQNRSFALVPGGPKGLLGLCGKAPAPVTIPSMAPADCVYAGELMIDFPEVTRVVEAVCAQAGDDAVKSFRAALARPMLPGSKLTVGAALGELRLRIGLALRLDERQMIPGPDGMQIPTPSVLLFLRGVGPLAGDLVKVFDGLFPKKVAGEGFACWSASAPPAKGGKGGPSMPPVALRIDEGSDRLLVAWPETFLDEALGDGAKLGTAEEFQAVTRGLPESGNVAYFLSARVTRLFEGIFAAIPAKSEEDKLGKDVMLRLLPVIFGGARAGVVRMEEDGMLSVENSPLPAGGDGGPLSSMGALGVLASVAIPAFEGAKAKARQTKEMSDGKQVYLALKLHAADKGGRYPEKLQDLVTGGYLQSPALLGGAEAGKGKSNWLYDPSVGESPSSDAIVLASSSTRGRGAEAKRVVVRADGTAAAIGEEAFREARAKQPGLKTAK